MRRVNAADKDASPPPSFAMNAMSQTGPYVPRANDAFKDWVTAFAGIIAGNPAVYGLAPAEAETLAQWAQRYVQAYDVAQQERTRTKVTIRERDELRAAITPLFTGYAQRIKLNDGISDPDKIAIGVRPRRRSRSRRSCPASSPTLNFIAAYAAVDRLHFGDSTTSDSRAKPYGAERLELFVAYGDSGDSPPSIDDARYLGSVRRNPIMVHRDPAQGDRPRTYWARWAGHNDDVGPWSLPASTRFGEPCARAGDADAAVGDANAKPLIKLAA
jgi:hypothetical protein